MPDEKCSWGFEQEVLPHLDAAYNLARWLTRNEQDAQGVVQEAYARAFRFFGAFRGENARAWVLRIVRNTCYNWLQENRPLQSAAEFDENLFGPDTRTLNPEEALLKDASDKMLRAALERLPLIFRDILILREFEGMSYREIAEVTGMPPGTVMSRLSRARDGLRQSLANLPKPEALSGSTAISGDHWSLVSLARRIHTPRAGRCCAAEGSQSCKFLGISTGAVKTRMFRAKIALHRMPLLQSVGNSKLCQAS